ncbi:MAG: tRNA pseudouridine(54/55) synthase Pus10 [Methanopyri archaeon]|nr:tRNA pseudouridine(54/55) synthase Pus10 [Methanopyri archaeon]
METGLPSDPEDIIEVLEKYSPCDHCLGRAFARLLTGLSNGERGRAVKLTLAMAAHREEDEDTLSLLASTGLEEAAAVLGEDVEVSRCRVCGDVMRRLDEWARVAAAELDGWELNGFLVGSRWPDGVLRTEREMWEILGVKGEPIKRDFNREVGKRVSEWIDVEGGVEGADAELIFDFRVSLDDPKVELHVEPVYVRGRYRKLMRGLPQSKWPCPACRGAGCERCGFTGKVYLESVEELIGLVLREELSAESHRFHAAGREDVDVRMLGRGRPFVMEVLYPRRRSLDPGRVEEGVRRRFGHLVEVVDVDVGGPSDVERVKGLSGSALKVYRAVVFFEDDVDRGVLVDALEELEGAVIRQRTPLRVVHRRADKVRVKRVHEVRLLEHKGSKAVLKLTCDPGLYVKELISGDEGRTVPSLAGLVGVPAECWKLDVLDVLGEW